LVLEKNPPKQGLKHKSEGSSFNRGNGVLEKNPPKQGLKPVSIVLLLSSKNCFREKSTKTRIETKI